MRRLALFLLSVLFACASFAQETPVFMNRTTDPPVTFEPGLSELGLFGPLANRVFKPEKGSPPYPAVVLGHTCGGLIGHIRSRARELAAAGFAVLPIDSYGPRGVATCRGTDKASPRHQAVDAYAALAHLKKLPEIDGQRIYYAGWSAGGMTAAMLAAPNYAPWGAEPTKFRALVSHYASCIFQHGPNTRRFRLLAPVIDTPILMLMAQHDAELKPEDCFPQLDAMKAAGQPVAWHVYPNGHHAWDQPGVRYTHVNGFGQSTVYAYDSEITKDATRRMLEFFEQHR